MIKKLLVTICIACSLLSCKTKEVNKSENTKTIPEAVTNAGNNGVEVGCYVFDDGKNKISLEVKENGAVVKGNLLYDWAEKDKNNGSFDGVVKDNILLANYNFESEGKTSLRKVAFKIDGDKLVEGYGEMTADGANFINTDSLNFSSSMALVKGACKN